MYQTIEGIFKEAINYAILLFEMAGVVILIVTLVKSFIGWVKNNPDVKLFLGQGIALALEFKLGAEVLRTVVVREWSELMLLGAIIVLRAAITFLIHWEIKQEERKLEEYISLTDDKGHSNKKK
ncbi:MAG: DUF1622 domain-containing protein [Firmicutes bacterium]|nr:DUF1622 domain-containing protein [Bacillota bacterium]